MTLTPKKLSSFIQRVVRIKNRWLRDLVTGYLVEMMMEISEEDRELMFSKLKRIISRSEEYGPSAYIRQNGEGFIMVINPHEFPLEMDNKVVIEHESDEILSMIKKGTHIHELEFYYISEKYIGECVICGDKVYEEYGISYKPTDYRLYEKYTALVGSIEYPVACIRCMDDCCYDCNRCKTCLFREAYH